MGYEDDILFNDAKSLIFEEIESLIIELKNYMQTDSDNYDNHTFLLSVCNLIIFITSGSNCLFEYYIIMLRNLYFKFSTLFLEFFDEIKFIQIKHTQIPKGLINLLDLYFYICKENYTYLNKFIKNDSAEDCDDKIARKSSLFMKTKNTSNKSVKKILNKDENIEDQFKLDKYALFSKHIFTNLYSILMKVLDYDPNKVIERENDLAEQEYDENDKNNSVDGLDDGATDNEGNFCISTNIVDTCKSNEDYNETYNGDIDNRSNKSSNDNDNLKNTNDKNEEHTQIIKFEENSPRLPEMDFKELSEEDIKNSFKKLKQSKYYCLYQSILKKNSHIKLEHNLKAMYNFKVVAWRYSLITSPIKSIAVCRVCEETFPLEELNIHIYFCKYKKIYLKSLCEVGQDFSHVITELKNYRDNLNFDIVAKATNVFSKLNSVNLKVKKYIIPNNLNDKSKNFDGLDKNDKSNKSDKNLLDHCYKNKDFLNFFIKVIQLESKVDLSAYEKKPSKLVSINRTILLTAKILLENKKLDFGYSSKLNEILTMTLLLLKNKEYLIFNILFDNSKYKKYNSSAKTMTTTQFKRLNNKKGTLNDNINNMVKQNISSKIRKGYSGRSTSNMPLVNLFKNEYKESPSSNNSKKITKDIHLSSVRTPKQTATIKSTILNSNTLLSSFNKKAYREQNPSPSFISRHPNKLITLEENDKIYKIHQKMNTNHLNLANNDIQNNYKTSFIPSSKVSNKKANKGNSVKNLINTISLDNKTPTPKKENSNKSVQLLSPLKLGEGENEDIEQFNYIQKHNSTLATNLNSKKSLFNNYINVLKKQITNELPQTDTIYDLSNNKIISERKDNSKDDFIVFKDFNENIICKEFRENPENKMYNPDILQETLKENELLEIINKEYKSHSDDDSFRSEASDTYDTLINKQSSNMSLLSVHVNVNNNSSKNSRMNSRQDSVMSNNSINENENESDNSYFNIHELMDYYDIEDDDEEENVNINGIIDGMSPPSSDRNLNDQNMGIQLSIDDFQIILDLCGKGAFGKVSICKKKKTGDIYALKTVNIQEMVILLNIII